MRIIFESLRFTFIFVVLLTVLGVITELTLTSIGVNGEKYGWIAVVGVLILVFILYKKTGWNKVFNKKILWASVLFIILFSLLIPDLSPTHLHTTNYEYSYGFPFPFLTLYIENGARFFTPNLFSGGITGWNVSIGGIIGNLLLFYFSLRFIFSNLANKIVNKTS